MSNRTTIVLLLVVIGFGVVLVPIVLHAGFGIDIWPFSHPSHPAVDGWILLQGLPGAPGLLAPERSSTVTVDRTAGAPWECAGSRGGRRQPFQAPWTRLPPLFPRSWQRRS